MFQDFEIEAYNENQDLLHTFKYDSTDQSQDNAAKLTHLENLIPSDKDAKYKANPSNLPKSAAANYYVYVNIAVTDKTPAIKKIVIKATNTDPTKVVNIDDFTTGTNRAPSTGWSVWVVVHVYYAPFISVDNFGGTLVCRVAAV